MTDKIIINFLFRRVTYKFGNFWTFFPLQKTCFLKISFYPSLGPKLYLFIFISYFFGIRFVQLFSWPALYRRVLMKLPQKTDSNVQKSLNCQNIFICKMGYSLHQQKGCVNIAWDQGWQNLWRERESGWIINKSEW